MAEGTKICVCVDVLHVDLHIVKTGVPLSNDCCNMQQGFSIDSVQWSAKLLDFLCPSFGPGSAIIWDQKRRACWS